MHKRDSGRLVSIFVDEVANFGSDVGGVVHSFEGAIYRVSVVIDGEELRLLDRDGKALTRRSTEKIREALQGTGVTKLVLRQESAYDEMIGQCVRVAANTLEVPLAGVVQSDQPADRLRGNDW